VAETTLSRSLQGIARGWLCVHSTAFVVALGLAWKPTYRAFRKLEHINRFTRLAVILNRDLQGPLNPRNYTFGPKAWPVKKWFGSLTHSHEDAFRPIHVTNQGDAVLIQDNGTIGKVFWRQSDSNEFWPVLESRENHIDGCALLEDFIPSGVFILYLMEYFNEWLIDKLFKFCSRFNKRARGGDSFSSKVPWIKGSVFREASRSDERIADLRYFAYTYSLARLCRSLAVRSDHYFVGTVPHVQNRCLAITACRNDGNDQSPFI
jgi:hypothetical protein